MRLRPIFAAVFAVLLVGSLVGTPVAAAPPDLNFEDEQTPNPYLQEDQLTIAQHDRAEMTSELQYFDYSGEIATLPAHVNISQDTPYTFRADQIDSDAFTATASPQTAPHPSGAFKKPLCRSAELVAFVHKANRNEVLAELLEPLNIAGRVSRKVTRPLDGPLEGGICPALAV
jgi:hypothetical protein